MIKLTPTQDLIMEVLAARYRLGEDLWTFDSRSKKQAEGLESLGYVSTMHGIVENSYRASLTELGKSEYISETYVPPILK